MIAKLNIERLGELQKGFAKLHPGEDIKPTRSRREQRMVRVNDKLTICVTEDDTRSNEQVIKDYLLRKGLQIGKR